MAIYYVLQVRTDKQNAKVAGVFRSKVGADKFANSMRRHRKEAMVKSGERIRVMTEKQASDRYTMWS